MKMEHCRKNNIKLVNSKQLAGKLFNIFEFYKHAFISIIIVLVLFFLCFSYFCYYYMLLMIIIILCKYYASCDSHINILHFVTLWNQNVPDRWSIQDSSWLCLSMGIKTFCVNVTTTIQFVLPYGGQIN